MVRNVALVGDYGADVELVYGTTKLKFQERPDDFFITKASEMAACGLDRATRFDLDKVMWIPWAEEWFVPLFGGTSPVIGQLTEPAVKMLQITVGMRQHRAAMRKASPQLPLGDKAD